MSIHISRSSPVIVSLQYCLLPFLKIWATVRCMAQTKYWRSTQNNIKKCLSIEIFIRSKTKDMLQWRICEKQNFLTIGQKRQIVSNCSCHEQKFLVVSFHKRTNFLASMRSFHDRKLRDSLIIKRITTLSPFHFPTNATNDEFPKGIIQLSDLSLSKLPTPPVSFLGI